MDNLLLKKMDGIDSIELQDTTNIKEILQKVILTL